MATGVAHRPGMPEMLVRVRIAGHRYPGHIPGQAARDQVTEWVTPNADGSPFCGRNWFGLRQRACCCGLTRRVAKCWHDRQGFPGRRRGSGRPA